MKILFLLPPSEGKNPEGTLGEQELSFEFDKPCEIAQNVTEKDLKCTGKRYEEGVELNKQICSAILSGEELEVRAAIDRYSGVMYNAIDHAGMTDQGKEFFNENFLIFSGMYGIVKPMDKIGNYKLPIETKTLAKYWQETITHALNETQADYIVNLLPLSYMKMIDFKQLTAKPVNINFLTEKNGKIVKISHGVKKIKGEWIKNLCETVVNLSLSKGVPEGGGIFSHFGGEKIETDKTIEINILKN